MGGEKPEIKPNAVIQEGKKIEIGGEPYILNHAYELNLTMDEIKKIVELMISNPNAKITLKSGNDTITVPVINVSIIK